MTTQEEISELTTEGGNVYYNLKTLIVAVFYLYSVKRLKIQS